MINASAGFTDKDKEDLVRRGKTPVLSAEEARKLLDSTYITTLRTARPALIGTMVYTFAGKSA